MCSNKIPRILTVPRLLICADASLDNQATSDKVQDPFDLFMSYAWKPFEEFLNGGSALKIFKEGLYWHASSSKKPSTTDFLFHAFDRGTF